jgi:hypothetical protein
LNCLWKVERAFKLWAAGKITIESIEAETASKGRGPITGVIKEINKRSGKVSGSLNAFSEPNWGDEGRKYLASINDKLRPTSFEKIVNLTQEHVRPTRRGAPQTTATGRLEEALDLDDPRMLVIDISDDENCLLSRALHVLVTHYPTGYLQG